jgi:hypothetical protein
MRRLKIGGGTLLVMCVLLSLASVSTAGETHYFKDKDQRAYRVELRGSPKHIISGLFVAANRHAITCDDGSLELGGWPVKAVEITNGHFYAVSHDTVGEGGAWELKVRGVMKGKIIRGTVSYRSRYFSSEHSSECWSGKRRSDPRIQFVARTRSAS